jgi:type I restriction enzyme S subunit
MREQREIVASIASATSAVGSSIASANREIDLLTEYRTRLTADVVTGKLDVREAAAALPEVDPLAADDEPDSLDAETETDLADPDVASEEADV